MTPVKLTIDTKHNYGNTVVRLRLISSVAPGWCVLLLMVPLKPYKSIYQADHCFNDCFNWWNWNRLVTTVEAATDLKTMSLRLRSHRPANLIDFLNLILFRLSVLITLVIIVTKQTGIHTNECRGRLSS